MKKKELQEYRNKTLAEIKKKIAEFEKEKTQTFLEVNMGKIKNVHAAGKIRKEIAQLKTVLNLKTMSEVAKQNPEATDNKQQHAS